MTLIGLRPNWAHVCGKTYKEDDMKTGPELHKRNNRLGDLSDPTPIDSTALAEKRSKVQNVIRRRFAARLAARKTCANMSGTFCVLNLIQNSQEGVDPKTLKQMTGFKKHKVHKILYKLFKHGEIRIEGGGLYAGIKEESVDRNVQSLH
jgi:hypothetical protein